MGKELYTWEQVRAYGEIALHNLTKSANEMFIIFKQSSFTINPCSFS